MRARQFELWRVNLNPTLGREQAGLRPCVILQTNAANPYGETTIIAPCTSKRTDKVYPYEILVSPTKENGLEELSKIKVEQVRVIAHERLLKKIGVLSSLDSEKIGVALDIIFDRRGDFI